MKAFFWILSLICSIMSGILGIIYCLAMIYAQTALSNWAMESMDDAWAANLANIGVSLVNTLLVTLIVNPIFEYTSRKLTEWERHHFDSDYERALTKRVFFNTFFNNNLRILMMLVAPRFTMYNVFKGKTDKFVFCEEGLCSEAMTWQILFFLLIKPITSLLKYFWYIGARRLFQRTGINLTCKPRRRSRRSTQCSDPVLRAFIEKQYTLYCGQRFGEKFTIMDDMNVRVAQYGFVVMFAAAFPLAPLIAFIIEVLVRRADVDRYLKRQQRPIPRRSEGVGSWEDIVGFVNIAAICTNVWIICFRSLYTLEELADVAEFFDANTKAMRSVILMSCFILLTSSIRAITQYSIIPERVKILQREEEKRAKEYMANVQ